MGWWTEKLSPKQSINHMLVLGALNGAVMALLITGFTTVGEFLGMMAAMSVGWVLYLRYGIENFRYSRLDMILIFAVSSIIYGALGYVKNM
jgi:hypothetical protein